MTAILSVILCLALVGADQFIKYLVVEYLKPIEYVDVVEGFLRFRYVENTGAAFSSFSDNCDIKTPPVDNIFSMGVFAFLRIFIHNFSINNRIVDSGIHRKRIPFYQYKIRILADFDTSHTVFDTDMFCCIYCNCLQCRKLIQSFKNCTKKTT